MDSGMEHVQKVVKLILAFATDPRLYHPTCAVKRCPRDPYWEPCLCEGSLSAGAIPLVGTSRLAGGSPELSEIKSEWDNPMECGEWYSIRKISTWFDFPSVQITYLYGNTVKPVCNDHFYNKI